MSDFFNLERFLSAQKSIYNTALQEIKRGKKRSHWMWFIFPQIDGLGFSATAKHYAIKSLDEAAAYLSHPVLGERLKECCAALLQLTTTDAYAVFGSPDDLKLRSSMTLFAAVPGADEIFNQVLQKFYGGVKDGKTLQLLSA